LGSYLDDNRIRAVSGLRACMRLEELHLANQGTELEFEVESLAALQVCEMCV
jgi:hypothetical protein